MQLRIFALIMAPSLALWLMTTCASAHAGVPELLVPEPAFVPDADPLGAALIPGPIHLTLRDSELLAAPRGARAAPLPSTLAEPEPRLRALYGVGLLGLVLVRLRCAHQASASRKGVYLGAPGPLPNPAGLPGTTAHEKWHSPAPGAGSFNVAKETQ